MDLSDVYNFISSTSDDAWTFTVRTDSATTIQITRNGLVIASMLNAPNHRELVIGEQGSHNEANAKVEAMVVGLTMTGRATQVLGREVEPTPVTVGMASMGLAYAAMEAERQRHQGS